MVIEVLVKGKKYKFKTWCCAVNGIYIEEGTVVIFLEKKFDYWFKAEDSDIVIGLTCDDIDMFLEEVE